MSENYGGWFVPFRYLVVSSFRLTLWSGEKTKQRHVKRRNNEMAQTSHHRKKVSSNINHLMTCSYLS